MAELPMCVTVRILGAFRPKNEIDFRLTAKLEERKEARGLEAQGQ